MRSTAEREGRADLAAQGNEVVTLTMTRKHAKKIQDACDFLMRMKMGQTSHCAEYMMGWALSSDMDVDEYLQRRAAGSKVLDAFVQVTRKDDRSRDDIACEIWETIRHALYMADGGGSDYDVRRYEPMSLSGLEMPKCEVTRE